MKQIPPLRLKQIYWRPIEAEVKRLFDAVIYAPLACMMKMPTDELINAEQTALYKAISDGRIWYVDGHFHGSFNAALTKELSNIGAIYNQRSRTWSLTGANLPTDLRFAQANADNRFDNLRRALLRTLDDMHVSSIDHMSKTQEEYGKTIEWMEGDFQKAVAAITIPPQLTPAQNKILAQEWGQNLDLYIKKWAEEDILELRQKVQRNAFSGHRANDLREMIQSSYGVSRRKAEFLARQETSLLVSKFREVRSRDIGSQKYRWSTSHDERVRHDHRELNGKIFDWTLPPVTNRTTGARNHPGEDFGCRCLGVALIE